MKHTKRKLSLHAQTLRNLSPGQLERVAGAVSTAQDSRCSTWEDTGCQPTGADTVNTLTCPSHLCKTDLC